MAKTVLHEILDRSDFSPTTRDNYTRAIDRWVAFAGPSPHAWTRPRAQEFYDHLLGTGIKAKSANVYLANLRYVSKWYATRQGDDRLDFAVVQTKSGESEATKRSLNHEEGVALLNACVGTSMLDRRDYALVVTGLETGMRRMSLCAMAWEDCRLGRAVPTALVPIKGPSGRATYEVPLSDTAARALAGWQEVIGMRKGAVFPSLRRVLDGQGQAMHTPGGELSKRGLAKIIEGRAEAAGLDGVHPHILRHSFITWRTLAGLAPHYIASITGHKGFKAEFKGMSGYLDMPKIAEEARNHTPTWLKNHVDQHVRTL